MCGRIDCTQYTLIIVVVLILYTDETITRIGQTGGGTTSLVPVTFCTFEAGRAARILVVSGRNCPVHDCGRRGVERSKNCIQVMRAL